MGSASILTTLCLGLALASCGGCNASKGASDHGSQAGGGSSVGGGNTGGAHSGGGVTYEGSFAAKDGDQLATLTLAGVARKVFVYAPPGRPSHPPLLIALHGTGSGDETDLGANMGWNFEALANAHGVVIAAPEARVQPSADWDQHEGGEKYWETRSNADPDRGSDPDRNPDLLLLRAIILETTRVFDVDPKRLYLVGFSNGGFFSLHSAVVLRDQVAAFVELSSGLVGCDNTNSCSFMGNATSCAGLKAEPNYCSCSGLEKPIPLPTAGRMPPGLLSHGNKDSTVSVAYTCALADRMAALGHTAQVVIRAGADHEMPDYGIAAQHEALWTFLAAHPLP